MSGAERSPSLHAGRIPDDEFAPRRAQVLDGAAATSIEGRVAWLRQLQAEKLASSTLEFAEDQSQTLVWATVSAPDLDRHIADLIEAWHHGAQLHASSAEGSDLAGAGGLSVPARGLEGMRKIVDTTPIANQLRLGDAHAEASPRSLPSRPASAPCREALSGPGSRSGRSQTRSLPASTSIASPPPTRSRASLSTASTAVESSAGSLLPASRAPR